MSENKEIKFVANVRRWGNSLVIVIPRKLLRESSIREGDIVAVKIKKTEI